MIIKFEIKNDFCDTLCPHNQEVFQNVNRNVGVGSVTCLECTHFVKRDLENMEVECKFEEEKCL